MTQRDWKRFCSEFIQPDWPDTIIVKDSLFLLPVEWIAAGCVMEQTGRRNENYFCYVATPLFIPWDSLALTYGDRVKARSVISWEFENPELEGRDLRPELATVLLEEALPTVSRLKELEGFLGRVAEIINRGRVRLVRDLEPLAYTHILLGNRIEAEVSLLDAIRTSAEFLQRDPRPYELDQDSRLRLMANLYERSTDEAIKQLAQWCNFTRSHIGLPPLPCEHL